jgi:hypothetical protein
MQLNVKCRSTLCTQAWYRYLRGDVSYEVMCYCSCDCAAAADMCAAAQSEGVLSWCWTVVMQAQ